MLAPAARLMAAFAGFLLLWTVFYTVGNVLTSIPSEFHEGTIWESVDE